MPKLFRDQFIECHENGTVELLDLKEYEEIHVRPNPYLKEDLIITKVYFCKRFMKRCHSKTCYEERKFKHKDRDDLR